ncbi:SurA N-terminal domain-containing protein [Alcaligenes aquatilis]|uniref:Periplasmic chaperone PpiD n=1 Tax=Alcaligenes faecalis TaxID=511 RepID=A0AB33D1T5_ALCFA|nr:MULTISPECIES: SurA N-terminal domain-containing protein [Alcaligenes]ASR89847.1 peptidylprolyl isomerase [Alcaligenes faecalis]QXR34383.1 SurA N-terminal domain-containing protein [Alcaligenes aquatilis]UYY85733.1 SurA N-terminal domain-containing protein [Alcaligenes sp. SMD-FA]
MFEIIRKNQRVMQLVLLVLILPSFVLIGVSGYSSYVSGDSDIVKVGDSAITSQEFDRARRMQLDDMQRNNPSGFDLAQADSLESRRALLESLIDQRVQIEVATADRFNVSDIALRDYIATMPEFQENGVFSPALYSQVLASAGIDTRDFEQSQRGQLALQRVLGPVAASTSMLPSVMNKLEIALTEERGVRTRTFLTRDFEPEVQISDADLQAWYDANKQSLELPQQVKVEYLLLNEAAAFKDLPTPTDEQLKQYYEQNKARYVQPGRVNISHILVNVPAGASDSEREAAQTKARELAEKAQANKDDFADLARANSQDEGSAREGGELGWISKGSWPSVLENAVFALKKGDVSGVIEGPNGFHIFKSNEVQPEQGESFEQARSKVQEEVRKQLASERFADMASKLTNLVYDNEDSLEAAANALGLTLKQAEGISRQGLIPASQVEGDLAAANGPDAAVLDDSRVRQALFNAEALASRKNAGVVEVSPDTLIALRVIDVTDAHVPALDKVRTIAEENLRREKAAALAVQAGEDYLKQLQAGSEPENFSAQFAVSRAEFPEMDEALLNKVLANPVDKLPAYVGDRQPQGYTVVQILSHQPGKAGNPGLDMLTAQLTQAMARTETQAVLQAMRVQEKVQILPEAEKELTSSGEDE